MGNSIETAISDGERIGGTGGSHTRQEPSQVSLADVVMVGRRMVSGTAALIFAVLSRSTLENRAFPALRTGDCLQSPADLRRRIYLIAAICPHRDTPHTQL